MIYLKWRLSQATWEYGPEQVIADRGGRAEASWAVDGDGWRIGYLTETADLTGLEAYGVTEVTEAEALTFCQQFYADAAVSADGTITSPPPPDEPV